MDGLAAEHFIYAHRITHVFLSVLFNVFIRHGWYVCSYVRKKALLRCLAMTERRDYVIQLPYVCYYIGVKSSFQYAREECESKRAYVF